MKKRLKTFQYNFKWLQKGSFLTLVQEKYEFRSISKLPTVESTTNTEDMLCNVLILALIVNLSLKSRVQENRKHGSVGVTIAYGVNVMVSTRPSSKQNRFFKDFT